MIGSPKALVFDLDGVICDYDVNKRIDLLSECSGKPPDYLKQAIWDSGFELKAKVGRLSVDDYLQTIRSILGIDISEDTWCDIRKASMRSKPKLVAAVSALKSTHRLCILSNNVEIIHRNFDRICPDEHALFKPDIYFSYQFRAAKPDAECYARLCAALDLDRSEVWFADDLEENTKGASSFGLRTHQYRNDTEMMECLHRLNL